MKWVNVQTVVRSKVKEHRTKSSLQTLIHHRTLCKVAVCCSSNICLLVVFNLWQLLLFDDAVCFLFETPSHHVWEIVLSNYGLMWQQIHCELLFGSLCLKGVLCVSLKHSTRNQTIFTVGLHVCLQRLFKYCNVILTPKHWAVRTWALWSLEQE